MENSNAALRKQIELLEKKVTETPQDESSGESPIDSSTESPDLPAPTEEVVISGHGSQAPLTNNSAEFASAHGSQAAPLTNNPAKFAGTHGTQTTFKNDPTDIAILIDSNRKFLDPTKLCYNQNVQIIPCGNIQSAKSIISESRLKNPQIFVFNTGVSHVEGTDDASTIAKNLLEVISITRAQFPTCKIVVSEITPRYDELNTKVEQANTQLRSALENIENVFIVSHENLKEKRCFHDAKHLSRTIGIAKLASNLVRGIRISRGLNPRLKRRKPKSPKRENRRMYRSNHSEEDQTAHETAPPPPYQEDNINIMREVLQQLQINGSLLSGLTSSRQFIQGLEAPAFPQTVYPIRPTVQPVY